MSSNDSARFAPRGGASLAHQALDAQAALLPYALVAFVVSMPVFVWAGSYADNAAWMTASFALFALACGATYVAVSWLRTPAADDLRARSRVHIVTGLVWAGCVAQIAAFADGAGPMRETLLLMATAAAVICIFFTAPWLPSLLVVGAAAAAGPLVALFSSPHSQNAATLAWGGVALAFALALMLNRVLRRQFAMAAEREVLIAERAGKVEEASRLARSKSDLVATLSHEIRNGLTGVSHVLAAAAGRNGRAAPSREQLSAALDAVSDLIAVLNTTLDSETAEAGRLAVDIRPLDTPGLVRDLMLLNRPLAGAKGLELSVYVAPELAEGPGAALGDPARVRQILANLIGNAIKFTVRGRVEARLSLTPEGRVLIEIADTGPGLSNTELAQAFEAFHRVERTSAGVPGAGLGLSLSRQLARLMNGELTATSAPGVGSCFGLVLAFDPHAAAPLDLAPENPADSSGEGRKLRILMAEDDSLNAAMMRAVLEQLGHQVVHAQDGRRAVDLARVCEFDLALIDGRMPGLDGPEATAAIRALDGPASDLPIIAVIGGDAGEALECTQAGADAVLRKPVSVTAVARAVADATAASRRAVIRKIA
ncbi:ATP-binding protein [Phenylobacterium sp.]|uniref:ATP-binding protein n=1 Tax=Phenylobacterium sp. TaxID=1871053 RepID=UPI00272F6714|nr:ATP-binding protein [Phenylobacterium sp.]MDP1872572.1 ATP-binding protein [Phenylobacterium sp.]MDP3488589.1 ATP-binding protein [Phenylobacterium sp.]